MAAGSWVPPASSLGTLLRDNSWRESNMVETGRRFLQMERERYLWALAETSSSSICANTGTKKRKVSSHIKRLIRTMGVRWLTRQTAGWLRLELITSCFGTRLHKANSPDSSTRLSSGALPFRLMDGGWFRLMEMARFWYGMWQSARWRPTLMNTRRRCGPWPSRPTESALLREARI